MLLLEKKCHQLINSTTIAKKNCETFFGGWLGNIDPKDSIIFIILIILITIVAVWGSISGETKSLAEFAARSRHNKYCKYIVIVQTLLLPIIIKKCKTSVLFVKILSWGAPKSSTKKRDMENKQLQGERVAAGSSIIINKHFQQTLP